MKYPKHMRKNNLLNSKLIHRIITILKYVLKIIEVFKTIIDIFQ